MQDVTDATNQPASTLHILANVPITVKQPHLKRSRVRKLLTTERYVLDQSSHQKNQFHLSCSWPKIPPEHRIAPVIEELLQPAMKSFVDEQADQPPQNEAGQMPYVQQPMAPVIEELLQPTMESFVDGQADQQPQNEDGQMPYVQQLIAPL